MRSNDRSRRPGPTTETGARVRAVTDRTTVTSLGVVAVTLLVVVAALNVGVGVASAAGGTLDECQDIKSSGTYTLGADITDANTQGQRSKDVCFVITADDVTLDGNGQTIELEQTAILVQGDRVTVENVVVDGSSSNLLTGIRYSHTRGGEIRGNEITDVRTGIDVVDGQNAVVEDNTVDLAGDNGIRLSGTGTSDAVVRNNGITDGGHNGIIVESGAIDNEIKNNEISGSSRDGIEVRTDDNVVAKNTLTDNSHSGLSVVTGSGNEIKDNDIKDNRGPGIDFDSSGNNDIVANLIENNNGDGIYLYDSNGNTIEDNDVTTNYDGIELSGSNENEIRGNLVTDNVDNGTYFHSRSDFNGVFHNDVENNQEYGIALVDAGGNEYVDNSALDNGKAAFYTTGNGANSARDLRIGTSSDPVTVGFIDAVNVVIDTTTKPPDGPNPNEVGDDSDGSDDPGDEFVETPNPIDPDVQTALTDSERELAEIMNVSDKAQIHKYVRVRPAGQAANRDDVDSKMDVLRIYYDDSDLNCNRENELKIWRYSPPTGSEASGAWRPDVGEHHRGSSGTSVSTRRFGSIDVQNKKYVEIANHSDTESDLVSFRFVDYHVFAAMSDEKPGCNPTPYTQPTEVGSDPGTEDEGSPGFGRGAAVVALLVVVSRRLIDGA